MTSHPPLRGAHPRVLLAGAAQEFGAARVVEWCGRLIREQGRVDDPDLGWLGGSEDWPRYWQRVRGTRGLLYVWEDGALSDVQVALRVREMACKVARRHRLDDLVADLGQLQDDPVRSQSRGGASLAVTAVRHPFA